MVHIKCRNRTYPWTSISRFMVADDKVPWGVPWKEYNPPEYNSTELQKKPWADKNIGDNFNPKWNALDGGVNRKSYMGQYIINKGYPLNPEGRTGIRGRGILGRWATNHAAAPIVTHWKTISGIKQYNKESKLPILVVCVIQRRDNYTWAFPGGMVDAGEPISVTLKREFMEEAMNSLERDPKQKYNDETLTSFFSKGDHIYSGYVDDPRNTDNAWIEISAVNFHDDTGSTVNKFLLKAGDDARAVKWVDINRDMVLNATHMKLAEKLAAHRKAHW